jgi:two-component system cell cycle response regulator
MTSDRAIDVLLVDDRPENLLALESLLEDLDVNIAKATSGNEALSLMLKRDFGVVLLDVQMPEMDGFETAELMRGNERTKRIPIIFVTAISKEERYVFQGYEAGAVDYLFKPLIPEILRSKVSVFIELEKRRGGLERATAKLQQTVDRLTEANRTIEAQQEKIVERERLKALLQMAGATAHELNQPLTSLLGNISMLVRRQDDPEMVRRYIERVEASGRRIADIVAKIQSIRHDETKPYVDGLSIIDIDRGAGEDT